MTGRVNIVFLRKLQKSKIWSDSNQKSTILKKNSGPVT